MRSSRHFYRSLIRFYIYFLEVVMINDKAIEVLQKVQGVFKVVMVL